MLDLLIIEKQNVQCHAVDNLSKKYKAEKVHAIFFTFDDSVSTKLLIRVAALQDLWNIFKSSGESLFDGQSCSKESSKSHATLSLLENISSSASEHTMVRHRSPS